MSSSEIPARAEIVFSPPKWLAGIPVIDDTTDIEERTLARIMAAQSPEELLANPESIGLRDRVGQCLTFHRVEGLLPSTIRPGDFYGLIEAVTDDGELVSVTTGSPYALGRIVKAHLAGWLPRRMKVVELESTTHPGQSSLWVIDASGQEDPF